MYFVHNEKPFLVHHELMLIQALGMNVLEEVDTLNYGGRECYVTCPRPYLFMHFTKILFVKSNFAVDSRNI